MRISDWSSDVCSSDLLSFPLDGEWKNGPSTSSGQTDLKAPSLVEHDHRPCGVALLHLVESIVDLFERYRLGDDAVEVEQPAQIDIDEPRDVDRKAVAAHAPALQFLPRKQVHRTAPRSEQPRVGQGGVSPCSSRGPQYTSNKT